MTRFELLLYVKEHLTKGSLTGLCYEICEALMSNNLSDISDKDIPKLFPAFTRENALQFGASPKGGYWWPKGQTEGRLDFLDWLIDYYQYDETDLNYI